MVCMRNQNQVTRSFAFFPVNLFSYYVTYLILVVHNFFQWTRLKHRKVAQENSSSFFDSSLMSSYKKKGLMTRSISKLSLNNLFISSTPMYQSNAESVTDLKQILKDSSSSRKSIRKRAHELIVRTPLRREAYSYSPSTLIPKNKAIVRRHSSKLWIESIDKDVVAKVRQKLSHIELRRQEAIFELLQGEKDLVDDLALIENNYHRPMKNLQIIDTDLGNEIFGPIQELTSHHQEMVDKLNACRDKDGIFTLVGQVIFDWSNGFMVYQNYCYNLCSIKECLEDNYQKNIKLADFLQRCLESPFSRKLDLKALIDNPRLRLMKYPLLYRSIKNYTPESHPDHLLLSKSIQRITSIVSDLDIKAGEAHCFSIVKKLDFDKKCEANEVVTKARFVYCSGFLKNGRGAKLYCVLFDTGFIVSRSNHDNSLYLLYRKPIPIQNLCFESKDKPKSISASKSLNYLNSNWIRIYSRVNDTSFMLSAKDEHSLKQWMSILEKYALPNSSSQSEAAVSISPRKRPVTASQSKISPKRNKCDS